MSPNEHVDAMKTDAANAKLTKPSDRLRAIASKLAETEATLPHAALVEVASNACVVFQNALTQFDTLIGMMTEMPEALAMPDTTRAKFIGIKTAEIATKAMEALEKLGPDFMLTSVIVASLPAEGTTPPDNKAD